MTHGEHESVLLKEAMDGLQVLPDGLYVDGTYGRGGHSAAILARLGKEGTLIACDKDACAVAHASQFFAQDKRFQIHHMSFADCPHLLKEMGHSGQVHGLLLDLGVSSTQLNDPARGFSFQNNGPLDMRMDVTQGEPVSAWLNEAEETEIADVLWRYGEERFSRRIARAVVARRQESPIQTTLEFSSLVTACVPKRCSKKHPATRSFQALRIHVNQELVELEMVLEASVSLLAPGGRLVVISFHSLEDRLVKRFIRSGVRGKELPRSVPWMGDAPGKIWKMVGKPTRPNVAEVTRNRRARSAVLRVAQRLPTHVQQGALSC